MIDAHPTPLHRGVRHRPIVTRPAWVKHAFVATALAVAGIGLLAAREALFPHGQRADELTFPEAVAIAANPRRATSDHVNADIAATLHFLRFKEHLEFIATQPGLRGDNARELLKKIRR